MDDYAKKLFQAGKEVVYMVYPDEVHDYRAPGNWISFWAVGEQFLHQSLGGKFEAVNDDLEKGKFKIIYGKDYVGKMN